MINYWSVWKINHTIVMIWHLLIGGAVPLTAVQACTTPHLLSGGAVTFTTSLLDLWPGLSLHFGGFFWWTVRYINYKLEYCYICSLQLQPLPAPPPPPSPSSFQQVNWILPTPRKLWAKVPHWGEPVPIDCKMIAIRASPGSKKKGNRDWRMLLL